MTDVPGATAGGSGDSWLSFNSLHSPDYEAPAGQEQQETKTCEVATPHGSGHAHLSKPQADRDSGKHSACFAKPQPEKDSSKTFEHATAGRILEQSAVMDPVQWLQTVLCADEEAVCQLLKARHAQLLDQWAHQCGQPTTHHPVDAPRENAASVPSPSSSIHSIPMPPALPSTLEHKSRHTASSPTESTEHSEVDDAVRTGLKPRTTRGSDDITRTQTCESSTMEQEIHERRESIARGFAEINSLHAGLFTMDATPSQAAGEAGKGLASMLHMIVRSTAFELTFGFVILANVLVMAVRAEYFGRVLGHNEKFIGYEDHPKESWPGAVVVFDGAEWLFGLAFTAEVVMKLVVFKCKFFRSFWNCFDAFVVSGWLFSVIYSESGIDPMVFRALRFIRLLRLLRLTKTFVMFDVLHLLIGSLKASTSVLCWALVFLLSMMLVMSLFFVTILEPAISDSSTIKRELIFQYFGTSTRSMLTMWEITLGNWVPVCRLLVEEVSELFIGFFLIYNATIAFAVISVIRGVFLHETFKVAQTDDEIMARQRERKIKKNAGMLSKFLETADTSGDGKISFDEFTELVRDPAMATVMTSLDLEILDAEEIFKLLDATGSGKLELEVLTDGFTKMKGPAKSRDIVQLAQMIRFLDEGLQGLLTHVGKAGAGTLAGRRHALKPDALEPDPRLDDSDGEKSWSPLASVGSTMKSVLPSLR